MALEIVKGKIALPTKAVIYGPEGVGKSTLAAGLPTPLFIDVEGGTSRLDVARTPRPTSWTHFLQIVRELVRDTQGFETLVIDTADWLEKLAINHICAANGWKSLGGNNDYGRSYNELAGMWADLLTLLENDFVNAKRMNVVFLAHSTTRKFELPEEDGAFDRYELAMEKKVCPLLKAWADMMLFLNYQTIVTVETDNKGEITKAKAKGGTRRMCYTEHTAAFDAKSRDGLPAEFELVIHRIAACFARIAKPGAPPKTETVAPKPVPVAETVAEPTPTPEPTPEPTPTTTYPSPAHEQLAAVMDAEGVSWEELLAVMVARGRATKGTEFANLNEGLINQWVMVHWDLIRKMIEKERTAVNA